MRTSAPRSVVPAPKPAPTSEPVPAPAPTPAAETTSKAPRRGRRLPAASGPDGKVRTVRVTVDLPSADRRALGRVADVLGDELDVHVPAGQVMAALAHLVADEDQVDLRNAVSAYLSKRVTE